MPGKKLFVITVDTEEDFAFQEGRVHEASVQNIRGLDPFQNLCSKYRIVPTYLCTYNVALSEYSKSTLLQYLNSKACDIGTHFHPWITPPYADDGSRKALVVSDYSNEMVAKKFEALHKAIEDRFSFRPVSFRSGRWVMNRYQLKLLMDYGYGVDTSVLPYADYSRISSSTCAESDYHRVPQKSFYLTSPDKYPYQSDEGILEIPVTAKLKSFGLSFDGLEWCKRNIPKFESLFCWRGPRLGVVSFQWTSLTNNFEGLLKLLRELGRQDLSVVNFSIHSNELSPGYHPAFQTKITINRLFDHLDILFDSLTSLGFTAKGISDVVETARNA